MCCALFYNIKSYDVGSQCDVLCAFLATFLINKYLYCHIVSESMTFKTLTVDLLKILQKDSVVKLIRQYTYIYHNSQTLLYIFDLSSLIFHVFLHFRSGARLMFQLLC